jgi:2-polyprenyl-6-methoxyphenol hydroxylase-like FAD-dependent oxidoreductase
MFNWVGISRSGHAAQESWLGEGRAEDALVEYADWHPTIRAIIKATQRVLRQAMYDREPLSEWRVGRVVLLGDAAHRGVAPVRPDRWRVGCALMKSRGERIPRARCGCISL